MPAVGSRQKAPRAPLVGGLDVRQYATVRRHGELSGAARQCHGGHNLVGVEVHPLDDVIASWEISERMPSLTGYDEWAALKMIF